MVHGNKLFAAAALAVGLAGTALAPAAFARGAMWHTAGMVGTPVFNDQHQQIGTISDVLVSPSGGASEAILSIGKFVGGNKKVEVPLGHLAMGHGAMMMHGATKATLEALPAYAGGGNG